MRRAAIITAWIAGTTLPLLVATLFAFGCCALPFHSVMHKLMPLCDFVMNAVAGDEDQHDEAVPPAKRIVGITPIATRLASIAAQRVDPITPATSYRDFISHGAVRCDRDVGLHVLVETFRI